MRHPPAALVLILAVGCQSRSTVTPPAPSPALTWALVAPAEARVSAPIQLKATLTNTTAQPVRVMLGGRPPYDFVLSATDGAQVWRWSDDNAAQMILEMRTLKPGERIAYDVRWLVHDRDGNPPPPGRYVIKGVLNMDPPETLETAPAEVVLTAQ